MPAAPKKRKVKALTAAEAVAVASQAEGMTVQLNRESFVIGKVSHSLRNSLWLHMCIYIDIATHCGYQHPNRGKVGVVAIGCEHTGSCPNRVSIASRFMARLPHRSRVTDHVHHSHSCGRTQEGNAHALCHFWECGV